MKRETNKEMDLLLRRVGRGPQASAFQDDGHAEHLDADELSSYAENALPAAARARYTEHLAECTRCRELIVRLSSSVGVVAAESSNIAAPSGLRKFLASLFSPMVLRYAVPALGLVIVAVIGLVVSRQQPGNTEVAMQAPKPETPASAPPQSAGVGKADDSLDTSRKEPEASKGVPRADTSSEATAAAPEPQPTPQGLFAIPPLNTQTKTNEQPLAKEEAAAAAKPSAVADDAQRKSDADQEKKVTVAANEPPPPKQQAAVEVAKGEAQTTAPMAGSSAKIAELHTLTPGARAARRRDSADEKDKNKSAETRTVSGRRFRKEDDVWIDTAYDSSRSTTTVTRGSEQYRALIADEPAIKNIAEQLDGDVIVVWKGRPYRIQ
jgi:hypothetical protein